MHFDIAEKFLITNTPQKPNVVQHASAVFAELVLLTISLSPWVYTKFVVDPLLVYYMPMVITCAGNYTHRKVRVFYGSFKKDIGKVIVQIEFQTIDYKEIELFALWVTLTFPNLILLVNHLTKKMTVIEVTSLEFSKGVFSTPSCSEHIYFAMNFETSPDNIQALDFRSVCTIKNRCTRSLSIAQFINITVAKDYHYPNYYKQAEKLLTDIQIKRRLLVFLVREKGKSAMTLLLAKVPLEVLRQIVSFV
jgi:hypothetical protein